MLCAPGPDTAARHARSCDGRACRGQVRHPVCPAGTTPLTCTDGDDRWWIHPLGDRVRPEETIAEARRAVPQRSATQAELESR